jgi:neutral ceramidase
MTLFSRPKALWTLRAAAATPLLVALLVVGSAACGGDGAATPDAGPEPLSTAHCEYKPLPPTARAGGTVSPGPITAGVATRPLGLPVGSALGGNTSRAKPIDNQSKVDGRSVVMSGQFNPSVGVETIPKVKALALSAGGEHIVILKTDTIFSDDTITNDVADQLGPDYAGKVVWASSHSHTGPEQYHADRKLQVGGGKIRNKNRVLLTEALVATAQAAIAAREPAKLGIAVNQNFDPGHRVSYDRRPENDDLFAGKEAKDSFLALIRVDRADSTPLAILPILGIHSAVLDDDVALFSTDISGMWEKYLEEEFDTEVTVMHVQGAGGDVLPESRGHLAIPSGELQMDFARQDENARNALPELVALWQAAGQKLQDTLALEMVTRSVELGPNWATFAVRGGALGYAPWDGARVADGKIFGPGGEILSPIDEFNARGGAGLCGSLEDDTFAVARMPGVEALFPYHSCADLSGALPVFKALLAADFGTLPMCGGTRATMSAIRLGDTLIATAPGEPLVAWARALRELSPVAADRTIVMGYAQGHVGYILTPEDWLRGGFEPTINIWGPLEGQYLLERAAEMLALANSPSREDATSGGTTRLASPVVDDADLPPADPAPLAGTVPQTVPPTVFLRGRPKLSAAQPEATIPRVTGVARFVWIGEDPQAGTPQVVLERFAGKGFEPVRRRSGRIVDDLDLIVTWTPDPLYQATPSPRTHYWAVEWQAVTWFGHPSLPALEDRPGLPLGNYRFRVEGTGYTVTSNVFSVVAGPLVTTAKISGAAIDVTAAYAPAQGWRMLTMTGLSNTEVPVALGPLTVEIVREGQADEVMSDVVLSAPGKAQVKPANVSGITAVRVRDRFGNVGEGPLP